MPVLVVPSVYIEWMHRSPLHRSSSFLSRQPIEAAPSGRIWPHSDQEGCLRNLRELPSSVPYPPTPHHTTLTPIRGSNTSSPALQPPRRSFRNYNRPGIKPSCRTILYSSTYTENSSFTVRVMIITPLTALPLGTNNKKQIFKDRNL